MIKVLGLPLPPVYRHLTKKKYQRSKGGPNHAAAGSLGEAKAKQSAAQDGQLASTFAATKRGDELGACRETCRKRV